MGSITLYHGSGQVVERPELKKGKPNNDYGQGFYCTMHRELACEWASKSGTRDGFVNEYQLDTADLATLDLTEYTILHWMTILRFIRADLVDTRKYHALYMKRDAAAREQYRVSRASGNSYRDEVFIMDLIRGDVSYGDIRL